MVSHSASLLITITEENASEHYNQSIAALLAALAIHPELLRPIVL